MSQTSKVSRNLWQAIFPALRRLVISDELGCYGNQFGAVRVAAQTGRYGHGDASAKRCVLVVHQHAPVVVEVGQAGLAVVVLGVGDDGLLLLALDGQKDAVADAADAFLVVDVDDTRRSSMQHSVYCRVSSSSNNNKQRVKQRADSWQSWSAWSVTFGQCAVVHDLHASELDHVIELWCGAEAAACRLLDSSFDSWQTTQDVHGWLQSFIFPTKRFKKSHGFCSLI